MLFFLKFQRINQQNALAIDSARGKPEKKAVFSPNCGDETTWSDRAFPNAKPLSPCSMNTMRLCHEERVDAFLNFRRSNQAQCLSHSVRQRKKRKRPYFHHTEELKQPYAVTGPTVTRKNSGPAIAKACYGISRNSRYWGKCFSPFGLPEKRFKKAVL